MKKTILSFFSLFLLISLNAQINLGPVIEAGADKIHSDNLQKNLDYQKSLDPTIAEWQVNDFRKYNFSIGGFLQYTFHRHWSVLGKFTFNSFNSRFGLTYATINYNSSADFHQINDGQIETIQLRSLSMPLMVKFKLKEPGLYFLVGLKFNTNLSSKIISNGIYSDEHWVNIGTQVSASSTFSSYTAKLDGYKKFSMYFTVGCGYAFNLWKRYLYVDLLYNFPITKSTLCTTDPNFHNSDSENRKLLSSEGKAQAESIAPQYLLNDFKVTFVQLSISYCLFKN